MNNVSRLYREPERDTDLPDGQNRAANQSSISGSSNYSSRNALSGQSALEEIRHLLLGDQPGRQTADVARLNDRLDSLERHLIARLDEQNNEIVQLKALLFQAEQKHDKIAADQKAFKAYSEDKLFEIEAQSARNNEALHGELQQQMAHQSNLIAQSLKQVAELLSKNKIN